MSITGLLKPGPGRRLPLVMKIMAALLVGFLLAELSLFVVGSPLPYTALFQPHEVLGYKHAEDADIVIPIAGARYGVRTDADGIIDRAGDPPHGVIILGDGVVAGVELQDSERLAAQLVSQKCARSVVNLSVTGYGPLQQALFLEEWIERHGPPESVVFIHNLANDLIDDIASDAGVHAEPKVSANGTFHPPARRSIWRRQLSQLARRSRLYGLWTTRGEHSGQAELDDKQQWLYSESPPAELNELLAAMYHSYARLSEASERYGFRLIGHAWVDWGLVDDRQTAERAHERVTEVLAAPLHELPFVPVADWDERWLVKGTRHANAAATKEVSRAVCDVLPHQG